MHWVLLCALQLFSVTVALLGSQRDSSTISRSLNDLCGTGSPSKELTEEHRRLATSSSQRVIANANGQPSPPIEIETWFHIVSTRNQADLVTEEMIAVQVNSYCTLIEHR
jgi:hypothetical protein